MYSVCDYAICTVPCKLFVVDSALLKFCLKERDIVQIRFQLFLFSVVPAKQFFIKTKKLKEESITLLQLLDSGSYRSRRSAHYQLFVYSEATLL